MSARLGLVKPLSRQVLALGVQLRAAVQYILQFSGGKTQRRRLQKKLQSGGVFCTVVIIVIVISDVNPS